MGTGQSYFVKPRPTFFRALSQSTNLGWAVTRPEFQNCGHSMDYRAAQPQCGCGETPGWLTRLAPNTPPARGLQSVVPASELAEEQKPLCGLGPQATIGLCAAPAPGLPRWAEGRFPRQQYGTAVHSAACRSGDAGPEGAPTPRYPCPCPGARSQPSGSARGFKGALKKSEFRRSVEGDPGEWAGHGGAEARIQKAEGESGPRVPWLMRPPQGLALLPPGLRLSGASSRPPQPRGPPLPGPSRPLSSC